MGSPTISPLLVRIPFLVSGYTGQSAGERRT